MKIQHYQDLKVWQLGRSLVKDIYLLTSAFPKEEQYGLTNQMRRAVVSIPSNIAEGHTRRGAKDYVYFLSIAIGSAAELETQLILSSDLEFGDKTQTNQCMAKVVEVKKMLHGLRTSLVKPKLNIVSNP